MAGIADYNSGATSDCFTTTFCKSDLVNPRKTFFIVFTKSIIVMLYRICWIGWFNERAVKSILNIPKGKRIDIIIALDYYDREKLDSEHDREPVHDIATFNAYLEGS